MHDCDDAGEWVDGLSKRQQDALMALLAEPTVAKAASACGVPERTLYDWLRQPVFGAAFRRARRETFAQAIGLMQRFAPLAVETLARVMADPKTAAHARVSAATALLKFARDGIELDDLAARVEQLEQKLSEGEAA